MGGDVLRPALDTFERSKNDLLRHAAGKWVLINEDQVVSTFESRTDALRAGYRQFGNVPFLVHPVVDHRPAAPERRVLIAPAG